MKLFKIFITPYAALDIELTYKYYLEKANSQIAKKFKNEINGAFRILKRYPYFQIKTKTYRAIQLKVFPFLIFYEINENNNIIKILSVFHTSQSPLKWPF